MNQLRDERAGLLADVLARPADDVPRLIFADWCEDNGEGARSEFIRVSIDGCSIGPEATYVLYEMRAGPPRGERVKEYGWLWHPHSRDKVLRQCVNILHRSPSITADYVFRRGFVAEIRAPLTALLDHGAAILRCQPVTRMVATDREPREWHGGYGWAWVTDEQYSSRQGEGTHILPECVYDRIYRKLSVYAGRKTALEALYVATLDECRARLDKQKKLSWITSPY